jgi:hypothetical protein
MAIATTHNSSTIAALRNASFSRLSCSAHFGQGP